MKGRVVVIRKINSPVKKTNDSFENDSDEEEVMDTPSIQSRKLTESSKSSSFTSTSSDDLLEDQELEKKKLARNRRGGARTNLNTLTNLKDLGINTLASPSTNPQTQRRKSFFRGSIELKIEPVVSKAFDNIVKKVEKEKMEKKLRKKGKFRPKNKSKGSLLEGVSEFSKQVINGYGVPVAIINEGEMFGQFALVNNKPRNAAIFSIDECEFMIFHKKHFNFIKKFYSKEFNNRRNFIENVIPPIADELTEQKKMHFIQNFTQCQFQRVIKKN